MISKDFFKNISQESADNLHAGLIMKVNYRRFHVSVPRNKRLIHVSFVIMTHFEACQAVT